MLRKRSVLPQGGFNVASLSSSTKLAINRARGKNVTVSMLGQIPVIRYSYGDSMRSEFNYQKFNVTLAIVSIKIVRCAEVIDGQSLNYFLSSHFVKRQIANTILDLYRLLCITCRKTAAKRTT